MFSSAEVVGYDMKFIFKFLQMHDEIPVKQYAFYSLCYDCFVTIYISYNKHLKHGRA
jgi:hypothetical protein